MPPCSLPSFSFLPDEKPVSFRLPTNDKLPFGYKEFALLDSGYHPLSQEVGYKEGWYDMTWEEGPCDYSKYYRDPSKEKPHFKVQIAGPEDYPSLRMAEASMSSSTLSTSTKE
ncbi:uncharacterized protein LOC113317707 [Papaver somniferum]|uniref:uncharacterized protein LOC113317707 n=1 Tax=Papaver somniferum TaxID=3469 RepID=UPI000E6F6A4D|nr:uncharacterized protein LOC113317707 [Papaver somniferum]